jgi:hypothetical protein
MSQGGLFWVKRTVEIMQETWKVFKHVAHWAHHCEVESVLVHSSGGSNETLEDGGWSQISHDMDVDDTDEVTDII